MCKIEELLGGFYAQLREEYNVEVAEALYKQYIENDVRERLERNELNGFASKNCFPNHWCHSILLCVYCANRIEIYFQSFVNLGGYVNDLVNDENFKELVMVAFYIMDNVRPREIPV